MIPAMHRRIIPILWLALASVTACESAPEKLLRAILERAERKDYEGVRDLVYPAPLHLPDPVHAYGGPRPSSARSFSSLEGSGGPGMTAQDAIVWYMREDRRTHTGDFSYSNEALRAILDSHMHRFTSDISPRRLRPSREGGFLDDELLRRTDGGDPAHFRFFDHEGCHILLVELDGEYKLIFWEGMNKLLRT